MKLWTLLNFLVNYRRANCVERIMVIKKMLLLNVAFVGFGIVVTVFVRGRDIIRGPRMRIRRD